jgi:IS605 OrfB family transposase
MSNTYAIPWCGAIETYMKDITFTTSGRFDRLAVNANKITDVPFNVPKTTNLEAILESLNTFKGYESMCPYLDKASEVFNKAVRMAFVKLSKNKAVKKDKYRGELAKKLGIKANVAYDAITVAKQIIDAQLELTETYLKNIEKKIDSLNSEIQKLEQERLSFHSAISTWYKPPKDACKLNDNYKTRIYRKRQAIIRLTHRKETMEEILKTHVITNYCFGTHKLFKAQYDDKYVNRRAKWLEAWRLKRNRCITLMGSLNEEQGNRLIKLYPVNPDNPSNNYYIMKCLSIFQNDSINTRYIVIKIPYCNEELNTLLQNNNQAILYKFKKSLKNKSWYLDVTMQRNCTIAPNSREFKELGTKKAAIVNKQYDIVSKGYFRKTGLDGMIGVDMNNGFLSTSYVNKKRSCIRNEDIVFTTEENSYTNTKTLMQAINTIVEEAKKLNYGISIEDLDFTTKKQNKTNTSAMNRILHNFATRRYRAAFESKCSKQNVKLFIVSPAYTTQIGEKMYAKKKKISKHQAAALVIAYRAMFRQYDVSEYMKKNETTKKQTSENSL